MPCVDHVSRHPVPGVRCRLRKAWPIGKAPFRPCWDTIRSLRRIADGFGFGFGFGSRFRFGEHDARANCFVKFFGDLVCRGCAELAIHHTAACAYPGRMHFGSLRPCDLRSGSHAPAVILRPVLVSSVQIVATDPTLIMEDISKPRRGSSTCAWVNIIYGCNEHCTYCVVPGVRGVEQSRPKESIRQEMVELAEAGYREVRTRGRVCGRETR